MQPVLINGQWTPSCNPEGSFHAYRPASKQAIADRSFPISSWEELAAMLDAGQRAAAAMAKLPSTKIADFLDAYADGIAAQAPQLAATASQETGFPIQPRLEGVEIPRTVNQLSQAAAAARSGAWARPTIDAAANIRSIHGPLGGPVLVLGPNNFPFAYNSVAGGDFAAAIAAGNPVITKAHPAHPYTTELLAQIALAALQLTGLPLAAVQLFYGTAHANGLRLVSHPKIAATAFTGSRPGGLALKAAADQAGKPIYLEMSSVNPVFLLPGSLSERGESIAADLHGSCTLGAGQFCTKPGLIAAIEGHATDTFVSNLSARFAQSAPGTLLAASGVAAVEKTVAQLRSAGAELLVGGSIPDTPHYAFQPTLLRVSAKTFLANPTQLQSEAFGPVTLLVVASGLSDLAAIAEALEGNLTGSIYSDRAGSDDAAYAVIAQTLRTKVGRLLNDKVPTGVAVSPAMNHGGPYPATGHPVFTAVGFPASIIRFSALHSYDNVRPDRLPSALRDPADVSA